MLGHSFEGHHWDGGALPGHLPFCYDEDDMRMVLDSNGQDINNRVGGGAGKRLSLPELQVGHTRSTVASLTTTSSPKTPVLGWAATCSLHV